MINRHNYEEFFLLYVDGELETAQRATVEKFIEQNPDLIESFTRAIYRGQQWVASHSAEEIAEVVAPSFPDTDVELLTTVVQRYKDIDAWRDNPVLEKETFDLLQKVMTSAGELTKPAPHDIVVNNAFAEKVAEE